MLETPPGSPGQWQSEPRRMLLRDELASRTANEIALMYWGAIRVLDDGTNPERVPICAFLLRELQGALPTYLPLPQVKNRMTAGSVIDWAEREWNRLATAPGRVREGRWTGSLGAPVATFLQTLGERIARYRAENPRWHAEQRRALTVLDPALGTIPAAAQGEVVNAWEEYRDYFNKATHHGSVDPAEFEDRVRMFERFLGDRLIPQTFAKRDEIAALIREAEGHAVD